MGAERRSLVMTEEEKKLTAYHEGGHALIMMNVEGHDPLHKVTIIPRGRALGVTMFLPERDKYSQSLLEMKAILCSLFGGRVAEELIFGKEMVTTGASDDIRRATDIARAMVTQYGFSERLGPLRYEDNQEEIFLGHSVTQHKSVSDSTAEVIDEEIKRIIEDAEEKARQILTDHIDDLHTVANALLEYETLSRVEIETVLAGGTIDRSEPAKPAASPDGGDETASRPPRSSVPTSRPKGPEPEPA